MDLKSIVFFLLAGVTLISALLSVTEKKIFRAAIYLLFTMMGIAGIYFWLDYEFVAAVQIIVYVGGIVVLIIFSIFLTHHVGSEMEPPDKMRLVFSLLAAALAFAYCFVVMTKNTFPAPADNTLQPNVKEIGTQMLSVSEHGYILPFEVVSMLLLAAMVGCIVIALKPIPINPKSK